MNRIAFATATASALLAGGIASAQGIALFGDARLGLGYNIDNDGGVVVDDDGDAPDDLRAISRVRFGVNMTGETDSGITFGASIRADNADGGEGGEDGQTEGEVFVSGAWGTLTFGDIDAADEQWVGDVPGNYSLTGLTDINETRFVSNGGSFGQDDGIALRREPVRPPDGALRLRLRGLRLLALDQPRPDRHRRRRRLRRRLRRRQLERRRRLLQVRLVRRRRRAGARRRR